MLLNILKVKIDWFSVELCLHMYLTPSDPLRYLVELSFPAISASNLFLAALHTLAVISARSYWQICSRFFTLFADCNFETVPQILSGIRIWTLTWSL